MDSGQLTWTIILIVVVLAIIVLGLFFGRRWKHAKDHEKAENLRQGAAAEELNAREGQAKAARAAADAQQAEVDAERLRDEARIQTEEAQSAQSRAEEQAMKADSIDPEVETETSGRHRTDATGAPEEQPGDPNQPEQPRTTRDDGENRDGDAARY